MKIETYKRRTLFGKLRHHFRIVATNGQIVAQGDTSGYANYQDMLQTIRSIKARVNDAPIVPVER